MDSLSSKKRRARRLSRTASERGGSQKRTNDVGDSLSAGRREVVSRLHWTQDCFWFSAALCLLLTTSGFVWRVWHGQDASIEWGNLRITSERAGTVVAGARDRLLRARTQLDDAVASNDLARAPDVLGEIDEILTTLGVAKEALEKQQVVFGSIDFYSDAGYDYSGYGFNDYGFVPRNRKQPNGPSPTPK